MVKDTVEGFNLLATAIGLVCAEWARVEEIHYEIFERLLIKNEKSICSIIYYSIPTFEGRRALTDKLMPEVVSEEARLAGWKKLSKRLANAASDRGKVAHYGTKVSFDKQDELQRRLEANEEIGDLVTWHLGPPRHKKTEDSPIAWKDMIGYVREFSVLQTDLRSFKRTLPTWAQRVTPLAKLFGRLGSEGSLQQFLADLETESDDE